MVTVAARRVREVKFERYKASGRAISLPAKCVAFAETTKKAEMLVAMVAAPVTVARGIAAMMHGGNDFKVFVTGYGVSHRCEAGYRVAISRLPGYSTAQVLIVADMPSLLIGPIEEALWRYLMSGSISTPMLPEWLPQIHAELERWSKISATNCFGCQVHLADFDTKATDRIVSELLRKRKVFV